MVIRKGKHWLEICDENYYDPRICYQNEIDGFWVAFLYENIQIPNANIESIVKKLVLDHCFKAAKLALPYYDRLIVFTSCDKREIYRVKEIIVSNIKVKEKNLFWKSNFESEQAWEEYNGLIN